jgi:hypothetical protein
MDKPKCRVCLAKHWASEPHEFASKPNSDELGSIAAPRKPNAVGCARCVELAREVAELRAKLDGRKAYQREYMRKRRAK